MEKWTVTLSIKEYERLTKIEENFKKEISKYEEEYRRFREEGTLFFYTPFFESWLMREIYTKDETIIRVREEMRHIIKKLEHDKYCLEERVEELEKRPKKCILF